jgi:tetratricopeptide (TPR) repeat protein
MALCCSVALGQESAEAAYQEGSRALGSRDYEGAVRALSRAVELAPDSVQAWFKLGLARSAAGDRAGAIDAYRRTTELDPGHVMAFNNMGNVYFRQGRYDEARGWYRRALDLDPDYLLANYHYGWILRQFNETQEAERVFSHCLELQADDDRQRRTQLDCLFYLGTLRFRAGDDAKTVSVMEQVVAVYPAHPEARYYLGMAYRNLGRLDEAQQQLEIHEKMLASRRREPIERRDEP